MTRIREEEEDQQREHTIHEELYIDTFHCYSWFSVLMTNLYQASFMFLASSTSVSDVVPCHSIVWASMAWRQQTAGHFHKVPMVIATPSTKNSFPACDEITHKCYMSIHITLVCDFVTCWETVSRVPCSGFQGHRR